MNIDSIVDRRPEWQDVVGYCLHKITGLFFIGKIKQLDDFGAGHVLVLLPRFDHNEKGGLRWWMRFKKPKSYSLCKTGYQLDTAKINSLVTTVDDTGFSIDTAYLAHLGLGGGAGIGPHTLSLNRNGSRQSVTKIRLFATNRQSKELKSRTDEDEPWKRLVYGDFGISIPGLVANHTLGPGFAVEIPWSGPESTRIKRCFFLVTESENAVISMQYSCQKQGIRGIGLNASVPGGNANLAAGREVVSSLQFRHLKPQKGFIGHGLYAFMTFGSENNCQVTDLCFVTSTYTLKTFFQHFNTTYAKHVVVTFTTSEGGRCSISYNRDKMPENLKLERELEILQDRINAMNTAGGNGGSDVNIQKIILFSMGIFSVLLFLCFVLLQWKSSESMAVEVHHTAEKSYESTEMEVNLTSKNDDFTKVAPFLFPFDFSNNPHDEVQAKHDRELLESDQNVGVAAGNTALRTIVIALILCGLLFVLQIRYRRYYDGQHRERQGRDGGGNGDNLGTGAASQTSRVPGSNNRHNHSSEDSGASQPSSVLNIRPDGGLAAQKVLGRREGKDDTYKWIKQAIDDSPSGIVLFPYSLGAISAAECENFVRKKRGDNFEVVKDIDYRICIKIIRHLLEKDDTSAFVVRDLSSPGADSTDATAEYDADSTPPSSPRHKADMPRRLLDFDHESEGSSDLDNEDIFQEHIITSGASPGSNNQPHVQE